MFFFEHVLLYINVDWRFSYVAFCATDLVRKFLMWRTNVSTWQLIQYFSKKLPPVISLLVNLWSFVKTCSVNNKLIAWFVSWYYCPSGLFKDPYIFFGQTLVYVKSVNLRQALVNCEEYLIASANVHESRVKYICCCRLHIFTVDIAFLFIIV